MARPTWAASGLLFENCSCQLLCPAHISFKNTCNHDRCRGHWGVHIDGGHYGDVTLNDLNLVVVYESPVRMYSGDWKQGFYVDERVTDAQREALDAIFTGRAGGPWEVLAGFVSTRLASRFVPIRFEDDGPEKRLSIPEVFDTTVTSIRGRDRERTAVLSNLHNVIHGAVQVLARGQTRCADGAFDFAHEKTHALYSRFSWAITE